MSSAVPLIVAVTLIVSLVAAVVLVALAQNETQAPARSAVVDVPAAAAGQGAGNPGDPQGGLASSGPGVGVTAKNSGVDMVLRCIEGLKTGTGNPNWTASNFNQAKGSDGKIYMVPKNEQDAQKAVQVFVDLNARGAKMVNVLKKHVQPNNTISDQMSRDVSQAEFDRVAQIFADPAVSRIVIMNTTLSNGFLGYTATDGLAITISTEYVYSRAWTWENFGFVLHELAHVAGKAPGEDVAHNREFFRVFRAMALAAVDAGVWLADAEPGWSWTRDSGNLGSWGWNVSWYDQQMKWLDTNHWNGGAQAPGPSPFISEYGTLVKARKVRRGRKPTTRQRAAKAAKAKKPVKRKRKRVKRRSSG